MLIAAVNMPVTNVVENTFPVYTSCKSSLGIICLNKDNEKPGKKKLLIAFTQKRCEGEKEGAQQRKYLVLPVKLKPGFEELFSDLFFIFRTASLGNFRKVCSK